MSAYSNLSMQELHATQMEAARVVWRICSIVALLVFLIPLVGTIDDLRFELEFAKTALDVIESSAGALMGLLFFGVLDFVIAGFLWGKGRNFLRLVDGGVEEHYFFWHKEFFNRVDLRTVTSVRRGMHVKHAKGVQLLPAFLFTEKGKVEPVNKETDEAEVIPYILIPRGVPDAEIDRFFDQVAQEIKRVNGGW